MIRVTFRFSHVEQANFGNVVILNGTPGEVIGSTLFNHSGEPTDEPSVQLAVRTKGFKTGFSNPVLEDVTVREVPVDIVEFSEF